MADGAIIAGRLLQFTAVLVLFGSSLFYVYGFTAGPAETLSRRWSWPRLALLVAAITGLAGIMIWVMAQTASISDNAGDAFNPAAVFSILTETRFGRICLLRLALLGASIIMLWRLSPGRTLWITQAIIGGIVLASFAFTGHGASDEGWTGMLHLGGDIVHLLAAGIWIGALVPLGVLILRSHRAQSEASARAAHIGLISFSGIGVSVVAILVLSGLINSWFVMGGPSHWRDLFATVYGLSLLVKLGLFGIMLMLAAANRFWLTPRLQIVLTGKGSVSTALRALRASVITETVLALLVLGAVAFLGTLEPPISS